MFKYLTLSLLSFVVVCVCVVGVRSEGDNVRLESVEEIYSDGKKERRKIESFTNSSKRPQTKRASVKLATFTLNSRSSFVVAPSSSPPPPLSSPSSSPTKRPRKSRPTSKGQGDVKRWRKVKQKIPNWWGLWPDSSYNYNRRLGQGSQRSGKAPRCNNNTQIYCPNKCLPLEDICDGFNDCHDKRDEFNCEEMEVNLVGERDGEGRVEITINNITGTICSVGWNDKAAKVVCRMFGYKNLSHARAVTNAKFGRGTGVIWLSQVTCSGSEGDLNECHSPVWGDHPCTHDQDAGVTCTPRSNVFNKNDRQNKNIQNSKEVCGRRLISQPPSRILGGRTAAYGALPWQARVLKIVGTDAFHQCGGTIIDRRWIVTAAHCIEELLPSNIRVSVGDYETTKTDPREQLFRVDKVVIHPQYQSVPRNTSAERWWGLLQRINLKSSDQFINDIALIRLRSNDQRYIEYNAHVQPACLPTSATPYRPGLKCEISGWGLISNEPMRIPDKLQYGVVPIMSTYDCERSYKGLFVDKLPSQMFCAGFTQGGVDTCQGDSGGPLVCNIHGTHTLLGVTSWGFECGKRHSPGIYTKVGVMVDWITNGIKGRS